MPSWIYGTLTFPTGEEPLLESNMPEEQEDEHIEDTPIGANGTDATIITYVNTPSIGAEGSDPFVLQGRCSAATKAALIGLKKTTNTLKTPYDTTGKSAYLKRVRFKRWSTSYIGVVGTGQEFHYTMYLLGR